MMKAVVNVAVLNDLRRKLASLPKDRLSDFWDDFFDLAEQPGFLDLGARWEDEKVQNFALLAAAGALSTSILTATSIMVRIPEADFVHGRLTLNGKSVTLAYFPSICTGSILIAMGGDEIRCARFSVTPADFTKKKPM